MNFPADRTQPADGASVWAIGLIIAGSALLASLIEPHYVNPGPVDRPAVQFELHEAPAPAAVDRRLADASRTR